MAERPRFHPAFEADLRDASAWYEARRSGLGAEFISRVRERLEGIARDPARSATGEEGIRYVRVARFPYVILFDLTEDAVWILAVLHTARSRDKWTERRI